MTEPANQSNMGIGKVCWTSIKIHRVIRYWSPGGATTPVNAGMIARTKSIVIPVIIAPMYPKIAFVKSWVIAPAAAQITNRIARS